VLLDHHTDEAWAHVARVGNRFAALQPVSEAVIDREAFARAGSPHARVPEMAMGRGRDPACNRVV